LLLASAQHTEQQDPASDGRFRRPVAKEFGDLAGHRRK